MQDRSGEQTTDIPQKPTQDYRDPRVYLAVERTFLAWLRTGLAMMGFGFVVARFGLFLRELDLARGSAPPPAYGISTRFGTALVVIGVAATIASMIRYLRLLRKLDRGEDLRGPSWLAIAVAALMALVGTVVSLRLLAVP